MQVSSFSVRLYWPVWIAVIVSGMPEIILQLSDAGILGQVYWRPLAYQYGGFWSGLLRDWQPNYAAQPWTMFCTYAVLHAGVGHLVGNLAALVWLGHILCRRIGLWAFAILYLVSVIGGAAAFGLLSPSNAPMVGASGALFGLAGAWVMTEYRDTLQRGEAQGMALRNMGLLCLLLVALNIAVWFLEDGILAWQTHLGGFVTGAAVVWALAFFAAPPSGPPLGPSPALPNSDTPSGPTQPAPKV